MRPKTLLDCRQHEMISEQIKAFVVCSLHSIDEEPLDEEFSKKMGFLGLILYQRCKNNQIKISKGLALFLCNISDSPGKIVLWAWTIFNHQRDNMFGMKHLTDLFPMGFPDEKGYEEIWINQKNKGENLLDDPTTWVKK